MANKLELKGFDTLRAELVALPESAKRDAAPILLRHARDAEARVKAAYPVVTGTLRDGVHVVERVARGVASLYTLITSAPYAHIFEFGSVRQPPRATFLPIAGPARRAAVVDVADMVEAKGLTVRGARD